MRVLLIAEAYHPRVGGGVRYETDVVRHLRGKGHVVDVLTVNDENELMVERQRGGVVTRLSKHVEFDSAWISFSFPHWLLKHIGDYELVHFNAPNPIGELAYQVVRLLTRSQPAAVCSIHAEAVSAKRLSGLYNKLVFERHLGAVDRIVVSSPNYYQASSILPKFADKIRIIPYGIDLSHFGSSIGDEKRERVREAQQLKLLFVGRLVRYKGIEYLISALVDAPGRLTVIGTGYLDTKLKVQVRELGLEDRVRFLGFVSDAELAECYAAADVVVLPSTDRGESFGYVLVEAMACHTAALSTEIGSGTSFINVHNETGFVVPACDAQALAEAIGELDRDRALLSQFKLAARQRVEELFDVRTMLERTEVLYRELGVSV